MGPVLGCSAYVPVLDSVAFSAQSHKTLNLKYPTTLLTQIKLYRPKKLICRLKAEPDKVTMGDLEELQRILTCIPFVNRDDHDNRLFFEELNGLLCLLSVRERVQYLPLVLRINDRTKSEIDYIHALIVIIEKVRFLNLQDSVDLKLDRIDVKDARFAIKYLFANLHRTDPESLAKFFFIWTHLDCIKKCNYKNSISLEELASHVENFVAIYQRKVWFRCFHREGLQLISEISKVLRSAILVEQFLNNHRHIKSEVKESVLAHFKNEHAENKGKLAAHIKSNLNKPVTWFSITKSLALSNPALIHYFTNPTVAGASARLPPQP